MIAAAVAAGTTAAFGAPTAGMIFSIEVATTYYMISNLWKAFFAATFCILAFRYIEVFSTIELFDKTQFEAVELDKEIIFFGILGVLCGLLGTVLINILTRVIFLRDRLKVPFITNRWLWGLFVALVTSLITFPVEFMQLPHKTIVNAMFSIDHLDSSSCKFPLILLLVAIAA